MHRSRGARSYVSFTTTSAVKRRTLLVVQGAACGVAALSLALVWLLSPGASGFLLGLRVGAFGIFTVAAWTLLAAVLIDFDRWVDTVTPVPKRLVRRAIARVARAIGRALAWTLAWYRVVMTRSWTSVLRIVASTLGGTGAAIAWAWTGMTRTGSWALIRYRTAMTTLWLTVAVAVTWTLRAAGTALTWAWIWLVRTAIWTLIQYRVALNTFWRAVAVAVTWSLRAAGTALIWAWIWLVRTAIWTLIRYRVAMTVLWRAIALVVTWTLRGSGIALAHTWIWLVRTATWTLARYRGVLTRLSNAVVLAVAWAIVYVGDPVAAVWTWGTRQAAALPRRSAAAARRLGRAVPRRRPAATTAERPWYRSAVDMAFGIPPRGTPARDVSDQLARARGANLQRGQRPPGRAGDIAPPARRGAASRSRKPAGRRCATWAATRRAANAGADPRTCSPRRSTVCARSASPAIGDEIVSRGRRHPIPTKHGRQRRQDGNSRVRKASRCFTSGPRRSN